MGPSHDICLLETCAIMLSLQFIEEQPADFLRQLEYIHCVCDNQPVVGWLAGISRAEHPFIVTLVRVIFGKITALHDKYSITVNIQWCRRGIWHGNKMADREAKAAVMSATPIPVEYHGTSHRAVVTSVKQQLQKRRMREYARQSTAQHLLSREFFAWQLDTDKDFKPSHDHRMLTRHALGIITMLRTGHSECFLSKHIRMHKKHYANLWPACNGDIHQLPLLTCRADCCSDNNSGLCPHCGVRETEEHFLLDCPGHAQTRQHTIDVWRLVYAGLMLQFNLKTLLIPPRRLSWRHRKAVLTSVVHFAVQTGRFKRYF